MGGVVSGGIGRGLLGSCRGPASVPRRSEPECHADQSNPSDRADHGACDPGFAAPTGGRGVAVVARGRWRWSGRAGRGG